jgi:nicotinamide-nucleotide amidase
MKAWIVAVGSEMLTPFRVDTNSLVVTERLNAVGCDVRLKVVVGDSVEELTRVLTTGLASVDLIVCTGGLGPTEDDITRDALARTLDVPLDLDERIVEHIRARFARRRLPMPDINRRQAMVPRGAVVLSNPNGTAPGLWVEQPGARVLVLPGPPREMIPMLDAVIRERIAPAGQGMALFRRVVKIIGRSESDVDAHAQPIYSRWISAAIPISTTILAVTGQIELHLTATATGRAEADAALEAAVGQLQDAFGPAIFSVDGRSLARVVGDLLRSARWRVAVGESCTGGLLTSLLTDVPGSSDYVERGAVCYSNRAKVECLGVPQALIEEHGAVSEPVARAMAEGVRTRARVDVGIGVTGIAGPGGGTPEKPVGTVAIAVVAEDDARIRTCQFAGEREQVKYQSAQAGLNMLRLMLMERAGRTE